MKAVEFSRPTLGVTPALQLLSCVPGEAAAVDELQETVERPTVSARIVVIVAFRIGDVYTRREISEAVGADVQHFLSTKDGQVVAGCFRPDWNPSAPEEVLVWRGKDPEQAAKMVAEQEEPIPVFLFTEIGGWRFAGNYRCMGISRDRELCRQKERQRLRPRRVVAVLWFKRVH